MDTLYYIARDGEQKGPYTVAQLRNMWQSGAVTADTQYWFQGATAWQPLIQLRKILEGEITPGVSPKAILATRTTHRSHRVPQISDRRILPTLLLWFFLGGIGAHHFYAGRTESGIWMLGLSFGGVILLALASGAAAIIPILFLLVVSVWVLIDFIAIVTGNFQDGDNRPITQWT